MDNTDTLITLISNYCHLASGNIADPSFALTLDKIRQKYEETGDQELYNYLNNAYNILTKYATEGDQYK